MSYFDISTLPFSLFFKLEKLLSGEPELDDHFSFWRITFRLSMGEKCCDLVLILLIDLGFVCDDFLVYDFVVFIFGLNVHFSLSEF